MGRTASRWLWLLVTTAIFAGAAMGAERLAGTPPVQHFEPDIEVHPQNFAVVQDARGIVYVGNQQGVLEFDGENWRLLELPNHEIVRTLAVGPDNRVWVGGYNTFGYLERRPTGALAYRDLTPLFRKGLGEREFADIWDIAVTPEGVYFRGVRDVFLWDPKGRVAAG